MHIAALAICPDGSVSTYTKKHLHPGERRYLRPDRRTHPVDWGRHRGFCDLRGHHAPAAPGRRRGAGREHLCSGRSDHRKRVLTGHGSAQALRTGAPDGRGDGQPQRPDRRMGAGGKKRHLVRRRPYRGCSRGTEGSPGCGQKAARLVGRRGSARDRRFRPRPPVRAEPDPPAPPTVCGRPPRTAEAASPRCSIVAVFGNRSRTPDRRCPCWSRRTVPNPY